MLEMLFLLVVVGVAIAFKFLPWEVKLGVLGVIVLAFVLLRGKLLVWLFMIPFKLKGRALRRAKAEVHSIAPTEKPKDYDQTFEPEPEEGDEPPKPKEPEVPRNWFLLDATITPARFTGTPFKLWEVGEIAFVAPGEDVMRGDGPNDSCVVASHKVERPAHFPKPENDEEDDYGGKVHGPHRVRWVIGVKQGVEKLRFQYYFEQFGEVAVPKASAPASAPPSKRDDNPYLRKLT